jgi:hypothetical protein
VQRVEDAGVTRRDPYLVSVDLKSGALNAAKLTPSRSAASLRSRTWSKVQSRSRRPFS